jgi:prepilin-type N-terminal cleavage/methylation domain-containing protein
MRKEDGFTLIEVMIAIAIFSIGILATWALQTGSTRGNTKARHLTSAATYAADRLERLVHLPYTHMDLTAGVHTPALDADGIDNNYNGEIDEPGESGSLQLTWQVTDDSPILRTKTVRVDVAWRDPLRQKSMSLVSHKYNPES